MKQAKRCAHRSRLEDAARDALLQPPEEAARTAGLRYVTDEGPGIRRRLRGKHFLYTSPDGKTVTDPEEIRRINSLAIPPAYKDVWICPLPNGHLQATGRDARGRKQYRYHPRWREVREENKYQRMIAFGEALPLIRSRVTKDLAAPGLCRRKVLAAVTRLLETTLIRVGNEEYARENRHFGLTTLLHKHVDVDGSTIHFHFRGKSGKIHCIDLRDARLAKIVKGCRELPGQELFQFVDDDGQLHSVGSAEVNEYLREISGRDFTAKDFRTWAGSVLAAMALRAFESFDSTAQAKRNIVKAIEEVARHLGNTPSICRKCYVHPEVLNCYLEGSLVDTLRQTIDQQLTTELSGLEPEEAAVLALLRGRLTADQGARKLAA